MGGAVEGLSRSEGLSRLARYGYVAGIAGAVAILWMGYLASQRDALQRGWGLLADDAPVDPSLSAAFALLVCAGVMFSVELAVRLRVDRGRVISIPEDVRAGKWGRFIGGCLLIYVIELGMLALALSFYRVTGEYGYQQGATYYKPWFSLMPWVWKAYLWGGLPYVVLTRALQHDPKADRKQAAFTVMKAVRRAAKRLGVRGSGDLVKPFDRFDRSAILGLFVKLFFVPVMTVFFADQFTHLVKNWGYFLSTVLPRAGPPMAVRDVYNLSFTVIFSIDVGLAWAGYVFSSRWIKSSLFSVEPTVLGWLVALLSYPPFNHVFGFYFSIPSESGFLFIESRPVVTVLAVLSVLSFCVYMSATACFGLRFSNLTHRGIVTTGPYAFVRHPAYAAKNLSWWCVMIPFALYQAWTQKATGALVQVIGVLAMSGMYYLRAVTEERHLAKDPEYRAYMEKVRYRFIPGLF